MKKSINEEINRMKQIMNIMEDDSQQMLMQSTEEFNEKVDEDLTPEEFQEVVCVNPDTIELPSDIGDEEKKKVDEFKQKLKTAKFSELIQAKKQLKELRKQQNEQAGAMITVLGMAIPQTLAIVLGGFLLLMVLNALLKLTGIHLVRTITDFCTGRSSTSFGIGFGRRN